MYSWKAGSAYLYILHLDRPSLAWEYLRRNPDYRRQWHDGELIEGAQSLAHWGCSVPEPPNVDGRDAQPGWLPDPPEFIRVMESEKSSSSDSAFSIWSIPGRRRLSYARTYLELHAVNRDNSTWMRMDHRVTDGNGYAYVIHADSSLRERLQRVCQCAEQLRRSQVVARASKHIRFNRHAATHAHILQALDGLHAGASQRDIAIAVFGAVAVTERWTPDSELRAQVRYLIRRGLALSNGGYRSLLAHARLSKQGDFRQ